MLLIAEVKTCSPFGYQSDKSWDELFETANKYGDILSIHTDARWGGSFKLIEKARKLTSKPILAKGIHEDDNLVQSALDAGADSVLVVSRMPKLIEKCLIEPISLEQLKLIPNDCRVVWNSRDLTDGSLKRESFATVRQIFAGWLCQASNIRSRKDIAVGADAILVGQNLLEFCNEKL